MLTVPSFRSGIRNRGERGCKSTAATTAAKLRAGVLSYKHILEKAFDQMRKDMPAVLKRVVS